MENKKALWMVCQVNRNSHFSPFFPIPNRPSQPQQENSSRQDFLQGQEFGAHIYHNASHGRV